MIPNSLPTHEKKCDPRVCSQMNFAKLKEKVHSLINTQDNGFRQKKKDEALEKLSDA
jgi:hypothetical protein